MKAKHMRQALAGVGRGGSRLRPASDFWRRFAIRAEVVGATPAVAVPAPLPRPVGRWLWLAGPAVAAAAVLTAALWIGRDHPATDAVRSLRMGDGVVHGAVLLLNDDASRATIVWIVDLAESA